MDSFAQSVLERARQRSKMLQDIGGVSTPTTPTTTTPLINNSPKSNVISKTKISTVVPGSPKDQSKLRHNVLNFQQEHFDMEIKLASKDNCLVHVEIQEQGVDTDDDDDSGSTAVGPANVREESKCRLRRLGKLYNKDEDDVEMSSPIHHRTEVKPAENVFSDETNKISQSGRSKLAALAQNIHQWENESPLPLPKQPVDKKSTTNTKQLISKKDKSATSSLHQTISYVNQKEQKNTLELNDSVVSSLECQGYIREGADEKRKMLTYRFSKDEKDVKENHVPIETQTHSLILKTSKPFVPLNRLIEEEKRTPRGRPSIHSNIQHAIINKDPSVLSLTERKAIFERNADKTPLLPKTAFALNCPSTALMNKMSKNQANDASSKLENDHKFKDTSAESAKCNEKFDSSVKTHGIVSYRLNALRNDKEGDGTISKQEIERKIREERQRDMDLLLNRFHKPTRRESEERSKDEQEMPNIAAQSISQKQRQSSEKKRKSSQNNSQASLHNLSGCSAQVQSVLEDVKEIRVRRNSQSHHHQQVSGTRTRLYPVLSDLETGTETEAEVEDAAVEYDDDATDEENNALTDLSCPNTSSSSSNAVSASLEYDNDSSGPTPPKCGKVLFTSPNKQQTEFRQQQENTNDRYTPTHVLDGDSVIPLQHTVSFYRKQQQHNNASTPTVKKIIRQPILDRQQQQLALDSILDEELAQTHNDDILKNRQEVVEKQITSLRRFITTQEETVAQASRALSLCNARLEFYGSTEQVEAERLLLLAAHRRQLALYEIGRLQVMQPQEHVGENDVRGELLIGRVTLPLKREYVRALGAAGGNGHHVVALVKCDDAKQQVIATRLVATTATSATNTIDCIVELIKQSQQQQSGILLESIRAQSTVTIEVYCLQAHDQHLPHHIKYHIKQTSGGSAASSASSGGSMSTPSRKLMLLPGLMRSKDCDGGDGSRMIRVPIESPGGPNTARTSSFALMGYAIFTVHSLLENGNGVVGGRKQFTLSATPQMSPLEGSVEVGGVRCKWEIPLVERRGFLTMYEDVTGFGAWHRRWFRLEGGNMMLRYWKYPDDEVEREGRVIDLSGFMGEVGLVPREVCARLNTIQLLQRTDNIAEHRRYLLSADTKEERIGWCNDLSRVIAAANPI